MLRIASAVSAVLFCSSIAVAADTPVCDGLKIPGRAEIRILHDGRIDAVTARREPVTYLIKVKVFDFPGASNMRTYRAPEDTRYSMRYYSNPQVKPLAAPGAAADPVQVRPPADIRRRLERLFSGKVPKKP